MFDFTVLLALQALKLLFKGGDFFLEIIVLLTGIVNLLLLLADDLL